MVETDSVEEALKKLSRLLNKVVTEGKVAARSANYPVVESAIDAAFIELLGCIEEIRDFVNAVSKEQSEDERILPILRGTGEHKASERTLIQKIIDLEAHLEKRFGDKALVELAKQRANQVIDLEKRRENKKADLS